MVWYYYNIGSSLHMFEKVMFMWYPTSKIHHLIRYLQKEMEDVMKCDAKL